MPIGDRVNNLIVSLGGEIRNENSWNLWGGYLRRSRGYYYANKRMKGQRLQNELRVIRDTSIFRTMDRAFEYGVGQFRMGNGLLHIRIMHRNSWDGPYRFNLKIRRGKLWSFLGDYWSGQNLTAMRLATEALNTEEWRPMIDYLMETDRDFTTLWKQAFVK